MASKSAFSGALQLSNVNDFLGPSQVCIKPIEAPKSSSGDSRVEIDQDGVYTEVFADGSSQVLQKAKITLSDCLACSGCVTTAESILVEAQSVSELMRVIRRENPPTVIVVTVSSQSVASISASYNLTMVQAYLRLNTLFTKHFGCNYFFDVGFAREIALLESAKEFIDKFTSNQSQLPILASSCPGWICYAEKNQGVDVLPFISKIKSPQQISGSLIKSYFVDYLNSQNPDLKITASDIYHITLMPCYDKKLEASRSDFYNDIMRSQDVDLVLTSIELPQLLEEAQISSFELLEEQPIANPLFNHLTQIATSDGNMETILRGVPGTSDSFAEYIFKVAAKELFGEQIVQVEFKTLPRPKGMKEVKLLRDGQILLSFATAYGFSNIANVVKSVKNGTCKYHYIEIMACPSGCLNGGGQLRVDSLPGMDISSKQLLAQVEKSYATQQMMCLSPEENEELSKLYSDLGTTIGGERAKTLFCTDYHAVAKLENVNPLAIQW